ncbi:MAG: O-antigen ligase domain-containing protein [Jaaginema sp. PMC 1079.18]|nr:O-antigen ligase domain-containing protein [Jaaginema sp. PMC 1080.18]MEC4849906.1 O-antigen ligase domain-containing protein [Jaaginema sp. PMC 1079.18]MEC4865981.1 O-antigen ligase domain-containing protein [Jaaginema sp. PMC 1078.18]
MGITPQVTLAVVGTTPQATLALYAWIPICLYLFVRFPPQRAAIIGLIAAWQFLPMDEIYISPLPVYDKMAAACYGILLGTILFDVERLATFTPGLIDIAAIIFAICPVFSQIENGLSPISPTFNQLVQWGAPYLIGRIYITDLKSFRRLAIGIFVGALIYTPFAFVEFGMGPLLHEKVYGYPAFVDWTQAKRYGGWRPVLFMQHGLMVGAWMMVASLTGIWLWVTKSLKKVAGRPIKPFAILLLLTFINCRSTGAWLLAVFGFALLFGAKAIKSSIPILLVVVTIYLYLIGGVTGTTPTEGILQVMSFTGGDRSSSLRFRFINEEVLGEQARKKILFGWGDSGNHRVQLEDGRMAITDSLWIILFGFNGIVALFSWVTMMLVPVVRFCAIYPPKVWRHPKVAPAAVLTVGLILYVIDSLLNAMTNPVYTVIAGGLSTLATNPQESLAEPPMKRIVQVEDPDLPPATPSPQGRPQAAFTARSHSSRQLPPAPSRATAPRQRRRGNFSRRES